MSAKHLGCHDRDGLSHGCHGRGAASIASCGHTGESAASLSWLAIPIPRSEVVSLASLREDFSPTASRAVGEGPEPPTEPPRLLA
jgi:hypothetical protein